MNIRAIVTFTCAVAAALMLAGCALSLNPIIREADSMYDARLIGNWEEVDGSESACSSHALRNWSPEGYAAVADHAATRHGLRVLLCGGRSELELQYGERIAALMRQPCQNLIGKDTLPELLTTLQRATVLISPDSGPPHMATAVGTPVVGLYAATRTARCGPYFSRQWCVDRYAAAAERFRGSTPDAMPWTRKIEEPGVMDLITPADVIERLDALMAAGAPRTPTG